MLRHWSGSSASGLASLTVQGLATPPSASRRGPSTSLRRSWGLGTRKGRCRHAVWVEGQKGTDVLHRRRQAGAFATWLILTASVLLLVACSGDDDDGAIPTTSSTRRVTSTTSGEVTGSTSSTAAPSTVEQEITTRYAAFWQARFEANQNPPNPDHPGLKEYATGEQLDNVVEETRRNLSGGLAIRKPEDSVARSSVRVVKVDGDEASLQECVVDDGVIYRYRTGEVVNDKVATHSVEASMRRVDGVWKVARTRLLQRWEGVAGCALADDS